mmetsp:Transcript_12044/g.25425  ORF Transcript_12044/g.25425 Transcript_12044/m.25425 type:complete len:202 (+) Transcript_12044:201-806(+)|eukprot:CAMPEP_0171327718 /NCGR_PEP_ID=MMETSP0878-20121228/198_1 /TAXON_ID=67004 /ORGANISM="Thalassiosira weissflogii, Strain CCMP1336" /LENGTH=201 /DNA_ID=CAMNT_0011827513 /DNA_START=123 /DNA_END=728 /DNA_ORIENTATION=+
MKLISVAILASTASAFAPSTSHGGRSTALFGRVDSTGAIEAALEASKKFGAASPEAALAWEIVEELDASDNSAASKPALKDAEYEGKVKALSQMLDKTKDELHQMKKLADDLKGVKLAQPSVTASAPDEPAMHRALASARAATEEFGANSVEAKLAWETVEEVAASTSADAIRGPLDEECLIELIEGCEALEKFKAALESR